MTDKEVGELWQEHIKHCDPPDNSCNEVKLIRKLVKERFRLFQITNFGEPNLLVAVLSEFGIDPATWLEE